jgi:formamidopyrimidine-DNA glycosylase
LHGKCFKSNPNSSALAPQSRLESVLTCQSNMMALLAPTQSAILHTFAPMHRHARTFRRTPPVFMPEGPECQVHAERLNDAFQGYTLLRATILSGRYLGEGVPGRGGPPAHWGTFQELLPATVKHVKNHGKFIWWEFVHSRSRPHLSFWSTLGMSGSWARQRSAHSRIVFELSRPSAVSGAPQEEAALRLFFNDQRMFGTLTVCLDQALLEKKLESLGPSWLQPNGLSLDEFMKIVDRQRSKKAGRAVPVAKFLMDQSKVASIGNYLLSESLYKAQVHPFAVCGDLSNADWAALHEAASRTTVASYASQAALAAAAGDGALSATYGTFAEMEPAFQLLVYRRSEADGLPVRQEEGPHGRSIFWVPEKQTRGRPA